MRVMTGTGHDIGAGSFPGMTGLRPATVPVERTIRGSGASFERRTGAPAGVSRPISCP